MSQPTDLTVVVPAFNEREALPGLITEIDAACEGLGREWEVLVVDDGSSDGTVDEIRGLAERNPRLGLVRLRRNFGKSVALDTGFESTRSPVVITIDGDGQDDPADIPLLLDELDRGAGLVSGWKRDRKDPLARRVASHVFNWFTGRFSGLRMHDMNCGFKAYRGELARSLELYGELHRYIPVLAHQQGWRVAEVPVNHRPRRHGSSRFGIERYPRGAFDLMTVLFLGRYAQRPLHLFGALGALLGLVGFLVCAYLSIIWIGGEPIGDRPLLFLGVLLIVVGVQLFTLGLLGQMLVAASPNRKPVQSGMIETVFGPVQEERQRAMTQGSEDSQEATST